MTGAAGERGARLLVASRNRGKLAELRGLLAPLGFTVLALDDMPGCPEVEETGATFAENARLKAVSAARFAGTWALGDDSGLCVAALGDEPGVLSARFAGLQGDDEANNRLLLERLAGVPTAERGARFVCALALARPGGEVAVELEAETHGRILEAPRGAGGFGYDPLFLCTEPGPCEGRAFAELESVEKAAVSHRGRALRALAARLGELLAHAS